MNNLLAQRKEIKRLEKENEKREREAEEEEREKGEEEKGRAIRDFEKTMMGLEGGRRKVGEGVKGEDVESREGRGPKRKFELDEAEMLQNAKDERAKARKALDEEKVSVSFGSRTTGLAKRSTLYAVCEDDLAFLLGTFTHTLFNK